MTAKPSPGTARFIQQVARHFHLVQRRYQPGAYPSQAIMAHWLNENAAFCPERGAVVEHLLGVPRWLALPILLSLAEPVN